MSNLSEFPHGQRTLFTTEAAAGAAAASETGSAISVDSRLRRVWRWARSNEGQYRLAWALTLLLILADVLIVGQHAIVRYATYRADGFDLGNMDQAAWNTLHGHPFRFTNRGDDWHGPPTRLGVHVEPIFLLLAPLYLLHSGPTTLIVLQAVALALGALPLFLLSLRRLPAVPLLGTAFVAAYLLTPEILGEALWDFHPVALATPLILLALWALETRRTVAFVLALVLAAICKEDVALSFVLLGLLIALVQRRYRLGLTTALLSALWVALCFGVILPHFNQGVRGGNNFWYRYSWLGNNAGDAVHNILRDPLLPFTVVLSQGRLGYLALLLRTMGGFGIFAPALALATLPELAVNLLSTHTDQFSGFYQYNAVLLAYLAAGAVFGAAWLYDARLRHERGVPLLAVPRVQRGQPGTYLTAGVALVTCGWERLLRRVPLAPRWIAPTMMLWLVVTGGWNLYAARFVVQPFWDAGTTPFAGATRIDALLASIPANASVAATDTLDPHLSDRYTLYLMPDEQSYTAQYVAVDVPNAAESSQIPDMDMFDTMLTSGHYTIVGRVGHVIVLHRTGAPLGA